MSLSIQGGGGVDLSALLISQQDIGGLPKLSEERPDFAKIDANGDGGVDLDELTAAGAITSPEMAEGLFNLMDADGGGDVSEDEFDAFADKVAEKIAEMKEKLETFFSSFGGFDGGGADADSLVDQLLYTLQTDDEDSDDDRQTLYDELQSYVGEQRQMVAQQAEAAYAAGAATL